MASFTIKDFLKDNHVIQFFDSATDWKDAIKKSIKPLIDIKVCTDEYYDSIIESTNKNGPYYILCEGIAMPHGQIGKGVNENGVGLSIFKEPIKFDKSDTPVYILLPLCAKDATIHTTVALPQIAALFENPANIDKLRSFKDEKEVVDFICGLDLTKYLS